MEIFTSTKTKVKYIYFFIYKMADIIFKGVVWQFQNKVKQIVDLHFHIHCTYISHTLQKNVQILVLFVLPFQICFFSINSVEVAKRYVTQNNWFKSLDSVLVEKRANLL